MTKFAVALGAILSIAHAQPAQASPASDRFRLEATAKRVRIIRDDWGIAHVHGKTDADAVFAMMYAQAEDDFNRIETNYLVSLGRLAEAEGEAAIWQDLRQRLFIDPADLRRQYTVAPAWLQRLMTGWADGLNYYLLTHPEVKPRVIKKFEPWMALSFSEGSIGGDIERVALKPLAAFYGQSQLAMADTANPGLFREPSGSNGIAIAPANTVNGKALLLINPHTSFFFRSEQQVTSDEGLNAYGAATWGQFFIYQGFNERVGWMHTSSGVDSVDEFAETIVDQGGKPFYRYGQELRPVRANRITLSYRLSDGTMAQRQFTTYATHHGPIVRATDGKWVSIGLLNSPAAALQQSFERTKSRDLAGYMKVMTLKANSSNNTILADATGAIAYLHPQFVPKRDDAFDYQKPVDGSDPASDWKGLHALSELPQVMSPTTGWITNTNNAPWSAAGPDSPESSKYPAYMDTAGENPRGLHAIRVLTNRRDFTIDALRDAAYDPYLTAFAPLVPSLVAAWDALPIGDPIKAKLAEQIATLRAWDFTWSTQSVATSLAVFWGEALWNDTANDPDLKTKGLARYDHLLATTPARKLAALAAASDRLTADFGSWKTPWGEINRFQRNNGAIVQQFDDSKPSTPVAFTSAQWGSLASFGARRYPGTKRYYGTSGNSFVAIVEFGDRVRARAVTAGGESGNTASIHFADQAKRYATGDLRDVYFYIDELAPHIVRSYHPGQ
ncbi:penicillin acylase family protein [Sphingomonas sp. 28-62-11]|uniref:penicillin acylase family protein n=1 Tax=Sphingomonas sp. 28-62-11 TaxID=1970432 RepID=UPI000BD581F8|nr:MAG: acylase [Sphingomonas sp. 28-62-11]